MKKILFIIFLFNSVITIAQISPSIGFTNAIGIPGKGSLYQDFDIEYEKLNGIAPSIGVTFGGFKNNISFSYFLVRSSHGKGIINSDIGNSTVNSFNINAHYFTIKSLLGNKLFGFDRHFLTIDYTAGLTHVNIKDLGNFQQFVKAKNFNQREMNELLLSIGFTFYKKIFNPNIYLYGSFLPIISYYESEFKPAFNIGIITPFF